MTHRAFILIEAEVGRSKAVIAKIRQLDEVKSVDAVTGPYDVIAVVESESLNAIEELISDKIHTVAGVSRTVTCLVI